ncbi:MAG TPA: hypothetical protein V6D27_10935 [Vampirovibrionales bacterium]
MLSILARLTSGTRDRPYPLGKTTEFLHQGCWKLEICDQQIRFAVPGIQDCTGILAPGA